MLAKLQRLLTQDITLLGRARLTARFPLRQAPRAIRSCALLAVVLGAYACAASAAVPSATATRSPARATATSQPKTDPADGAVKPFWARRITGYLRSRDGVPLKYVVFLPAKTGRFPVALFSTGYATGSVGGFSPRLDRMLVEHGYAVMGLNVSGTGCSGGNHFSVYGSNWGRDGYDAVEFAARQPWSDGKVGMYGWSWGGVNQLATAINHPPHLKAIAPGMVITDLRLDETSPGGVNGNFLYWAWGYFSQPCSAGQQHCVKGASEYAGLLQGTWEEVRKTAEKDHDAECLRNLKHNIQLEQENSFERALFEHPLRDAWMQGGARQLRLQTHLISVPVLSVVALTDEAMTSREGYYQETLDPNRTWLLQSNGPHDLYGSAQVGKVLVAFFDRFVKGVPNGFDRSPHLTVWMDTHTNSDGDYGDYMWTATPGWQFTSRKLLPAVQPASFTLSEGGQLLTRGSGSGRPDAYKYPMPGPAVNVNVERPAWGPMPVDWRKGSLAYTSSPFKHEMLAYGPASVDLWVSSNSPDSDLQVTLTEVRPDGQEMYLQRGWLRLSDRAVDAARSTPERPVLLDRPDTIQVLNPGVPVLARVEIPPFAAELRQGYRIRIWIDTPSPRGDFRFDYISWPATNEIWHDKTHPSRLVIGKLDLSDLHVPPKAARCGTSMTEPCRRDPLSN